MNIHSAKICGLSSLGLLKINGRDAKKLLQGQFTCNMDEVTSCQSRLGAHCNPQGRVLSLFYVFLFQDSYYLVMPRHLVPLAMMALKKYAIFYETGLTDAGDDLIIMGYIGEERKRDDHYAVIQTATCSSIKIVSERYLMIGHREVMKQTWERLAHTSSILSSQEWKQLDLHDGVPAIYPETSGKFLPHEINLEKLGAIHFDKGCYTGQEIIARMHYRGKLKKHMHQATILSQSPPLPGSDVYSQQGQEIKMSGVIVDVCLSTKNNNHYDALIIIDGSDAKNHHLFLDKNAVASERVFLCLGTVHK